jgi:hypothetical protein
MAGANWSEAGVRVRLDGTVEPGHHWRVREVPGGAYWLSVYKDEARVAAVAVDGCPLHTLPDLHMRHGEASFDGLRLWSWPLRLHERDGVFLLAYDPEPGDWMAAVSVAAYDGRGWCGCDAPVAEMALGWFAKEMVNRDLRVWPMMRAGLLAAMVATRPDPNSRVGAGK